MPVTVMDAEEQDSMAMIRRPPVDVRRREFMLILGIVSGFKCHFWARDANCLTREKCAFMSIPFRFALSPGPLKNQPT